LIEINLLPPEFRKKETKKFNMPDLPYLRIGGTFFLAMLGVEALLFAGLLFMKSNLSGLEKEIKTLGPDFDRIQKVKLGKARSGTYLRLLGGMMTRPFYWTQLLNAISNSLPETLWLTEISIERKMIDIEVKKAPESAPAPNAKGKKPRRISTPKNIRKAEYYLVIRGAAPINERSTAAVGKFIQQLEEQPVVRQITEHVKLEKIDRISDRKDQQSYVFTIRSLMKSGYGDEDAD